MHIFQGLMSNKGEVSDKEWASVFEVCDKQCSLLPSDLAQRLHSHVNELELVPYAATQVCGGNPGALTTTSRLWKTLGDVQAGWSFTLAVHDASSTMLQHADRIARLWSQLLGWCGAPP